VFFPNRKGLARKYLVSMIILIMSFFIIFQAAIFAFDHLNKNAAEEVCRASVKARMDVVLRTKIEGVSVQTRPMVPIMCKTIDKKKLKGNEREVKKQIADLTTKCWHMFLDGEYENLFNRLDLLFGQNRCFICYTFSIDDDKVEITGDEFKHYMLKTPYPYIFENLKSEDEKDKKQESKTEDEKQKSITYLDYIQSYKGDGAVIINNDENFAFKKDKQYAIAFLSPDLGTGTLGTSWNTYTAYNDLFFGVISKEEAEEKRRYPFINKIVIDELDSIKKNTKCTKIVESK